MHVCMHLYLKAWHTIHYIHGLSFFNGFTNNLFSQSRQIRLLLQNTNIVHTTYWKKENLSYNMHGYKIRISYSLKMYFLVCGDWHTAKHLEPRTTLRNVLPPVVQWVVSVGTGPGVLAEHLAYHIAVGTRPSTEKQTEKDVLRGARRVVRSELPVQLNTTNIRLIGFKWKTKPKEFVQLQWQMQLHNDRKKQLNETLPKRPEAW